MIADVKNFPKPTLSEIAAVQFFVETFEVLMYLRGESKEVHNLGDSGSADALISMAESLVEASRKGR